MYIDYYIINYTRISEFVHTEYSNAVQRKHCVQIFKTEIADHETLD